tara:strand:- start:25 stop:435 length:411 start_codon:yes stop_codon:yes gene_type:complete
MTERTVGFTNGCFDILHIGHLKLLSHLKHKCDIVIAAIDSDSRVRQLKGSARPFNSQDDRKYMLQSLRYVDMVYIFDSEQALEQIIKNHNPDLMIVGSEYKERRVVGSQYAKKLEFFEKIDGYSTTKILQNRSDWR